MATQTDGRPDSTTDESTGDDVLRQRNVPEAIRSLSTLAKPDYVHPRVESEIEHHRRRRRFE